jgi:hypothetical protein
LVEIIARSLPGHFITLLSFLLIFIPLFLPSIYIDDSNAVPEQQQTSQGEAVVIVPGIMDNLLTLISFLFLACFFILGLRIQRAERTTTGSTSSPTSSLIDKHFLLLILVSLIPAIIIIIYGIVLIGMYIYGTINTSSGKSAYMQGNVSYLLLLFIWFVPTGAVLFLVKKLHLGTPIYNIGTSRYTKEEFLSVAVKVCPKLSEEMAIIIGEEVWKAKGDVHDIISASTIVQKGDGRDEIKEIITTLKKYGYERT